MAVQLSCRLANALDLFPRQLYRDPHPLLPCPCIIETGKTKLGETKQLFRRGCRPHHGAFGHFTEVLHVCSYAFLGISGIDGLGVHLHGADGDIVVCQRPDLIVGQRLRVVGLGAFYVLLVVGHLSASVQSCDGKTNPAGQHLPVQEAAPANSLLCADERIAHLIKDKVCIVIGAGQDIGRAAAKRLDAEGAKVVVKA